MEQLEGKKVASRFWTEWCHATWSNKGQMWQRKGPKSLCSAGCTPWPQHQDCSIWL